MKKEITAKQANKIVESMPALEVQDFAKTNEYELAKEVKSLRLFVAQLFLEIKDLREQLKPVPGVYVDMMERDTEDGS